MFVCFLCSQISFQFQGEKKSNGEKRAGRERERELDKDLSKIVREGSRERERKLLDNNVLNCGK